MSVERITRLEDLAADWLARLGLLSDRLIAPHATNATETDLAHYAAHGVSVVHCPLVAARGGSILRSFGRLRAQGINIAMGTEIDNIIEFEEIDCRHPGGREGLEMAGLLE